MKSTETKLAEIMLKLEHIDENQSNMIESYNGKFKMTDDRITRECKVIEKIDDRLQAVEVKQAIVVTKLAMLVSGAIFALYFLIERAWNFIFS